MPRFRNPVISTANLLDGSVTTPKLADGAVSSIKLAVDLQSDNFVAGVSGWRIRRVTGNAEFNDVTVRGTIFATAGQIGTLDIAGTLTMTAGGVIRTATGSTRLEISNANSTRLDFFQGGASPGAKIVGGTGGAQTLHVLADTLLFSNTGDTGFRMTITSVGVTAFSPVYLATGSVAVPSLAFLNETQTGWFRESAGIIGFGLSGTKQFDFRSAGMLFQGAFLGTTAAGANGVFVSLGGGAYLLQRSTSSARYKSGLRSWDARHRVLDLTPTLYRSALPGDDGRRVRLGLIAEEVAAIFPLAAVYDAEGRPDAIDWSVITAGLLAGVIDLAGRVAVLESRR